MSGGPSRSDVAGKVYSNTGNPAVVALIDSGARDILDVGCGTGSNAMLLKQRNPHARVFGISASEAECLAASSHLEKCWIADLEAGFPAEARAREYDVVVFSHVLEHLRFPAALVEQAASLIKPGGSCLIAVPNVLSWAQRVNFLMGRFEYESAGVMDNTHFRFFTFRTAANYLLRDTQSFEIESQSVTGSVPLWVLRRHVLPQSLAAAVDRAGCAALPNLFGSQILIKARKKT